MGLFNAVFSNNSLQNGRTSPYSFLFQKFNEPQNLSGNDLRQLDSLFQQKNWDSLTVDEKKSAVQALEKRFAFEQGREPVLITFDPIGANLYGGYDPITNTISLNENLLRYGNLDGSWIPFPDRNFQIYDTIAHEGFHAYQEYAINHPEMFPNETRIEQWRRNSGRGYLGSDDLRYRVQPQERDAWEYGEQKARAAIPITDPGYSCYDEFTKGYSFEGQIQRINATKPELLKEMDEMYGTDYDARYGIGNNKYTDEINMLDSQQSKENDIESLYRDDTAIVDNIEENQEVFDAPHGQLNEEQINFEETDLLLNQNSSRNQESFITDSYDVIENGDENTEAHLIKDTFQEDNDVFNVPSVSEQKHDLNTEYEHVDLNEEISSVDNQQNVANEQDNLQETSDVNEENTESSNEEIERLYDSKENMAVDSFNDEQLTDSISKTDIQSVRNDSNESSDYQPMEIETKDVTETVSDDIALEFDSMENDDIQNVEDNQGPSLIDDNEQIPTDESQQFDLSNDIEQNEPELLGDEEQLMIQNESAEEPELLDENDFEQYSAIGNENSSIENNEPEIIDSNVDEHEMDTSEESNSEDESSTYSI